MRFQVLCKGECITDGEMLLTVRAKDEEAAIKKVYKQYPGVEHAELVNEYSKLEMFKSYNCPVSIAHKRGKVRGYGMYI